jgi:sigma-B regulation protein RsbU (phosphoserine phosphatase)
LFEEERNEDLADLYENAPCGYLSIRPNGRIAKVNKTLCRWLGKSADDIIGKRLRELLNVAGSIFYETHFAPLLRMQGFFDEVALDMVMADGTVMPVIANASERRDENGNVIFTRITIFRAVERRRYERELVNARDHLAQDIARQIEERRADKQDGILREQFIAVLGHDLRNPLAAIEAGRRLLTKEHDDAKTVRILRLMGESVGRMGGLIDNLMDFARGRLGGGIGVQITRGERIEPTLAAVVNELKVSYPDREIETRFDLQEPVPVDHARMAQMFSNLLANAITHGAQDQPIVVEASMDGEFFGLSVRNGGDPIPQAAMDRLFQPFYRGEVRPSAQGLGLGLYIASQIAEAHGGRIDVQSDERETAFTFRMQVVSLATSDFDGVLPRT